MSGKFFLDTNIIVYTFDAKNSSKQGIAQNLLTEALSSQKGCISWQVVQEFMNVSRHKFLSPLTIDDCYSYLNEILGPICEIYPSLSLYEKALTLSGRWQYRFFDALIIASALEAKCNILYSEDLQHGQKIESLKIINPFV